MLSRSKELKKIEEYGGHKRIHSPERRGLKGFSLEISCDKCKQAIPLIEGTFCGLRKEKGGEALCKSCPYFDAESLEYRLFRRT